MEHAEPTPGSDRAYRAARQDLRTLEQLGVPWVALAARRPAATMAGDHEGAAAPPTVPAPPMASVGSADQRVASPVGAGGSPAPAPARASRTRKAEVRVVEPKPVPPPAEAGAVVDAGASEANQGAGASWSAGRSDAAASDETLASGQDKRALLAALRDRYERESVVAQRIKGWHNIVFGDGDPDARLMFVGEAPGEDEDLQGIPFVGRAGKKLNEMIAAMGYARESVYIANVLKVRPPDNRTPTPEEAELDGPFLLEQIRIVRPSVIVTLGKPAAQYLLNDTRSMGAIRGIWHEHAGIPVMPTYHPAYLLRAYTPENRQKVWSDLQKVVARLDALAH